MKKTIALKIYKTIKNYIASFIIVTALFTFFATATADSYITSEDPLVSLSYLDKVTAGMKAEIKDEVLASLSDIIKEEIAKYSAGGTTVVTPEYKNETLSIGQKIIASGSCEIIVLSGSARAICPSSVHTLTDKTDEISIQNNTEITKNHLILIPRADGRGIVSTWNDTKILIRGQYEIK